MRSRDHLNRRALVEVWLCGELLSHSYHLWERHTEQKHSGAHLLAHNDGDTMAPLIYTRRCRKEPSECEAHPNYFLRLCGGKSRLTPPHYRPFCPPVRLISQSGSSVRLSAGVPPRLQNVSRRTRTHLSIADGGLTGTTLGFKDTGRTKRAGDT